MIDRYISSGVLVVYENGDYFCWDKASALKFAEYMGIMGHDCEFYVATMENGVITRRRRIDTSLLKEKVGRHQNRKVSAPNVRGGIIK